MSNLIDPSEMYEETDDSNSAKIRLMICPVCKTIDPLPDYNGPDEYDDTGQARATLHMFNDDKFHPFIVGKVSEKSWNNPRVRPEIVKKLSEELTPAGEGGGLGQEVYDIKDTFAEDAMRCWRIEHSRTKDCGDWKIDRKRLIPHTQAERKAEGLPHRARDIQSNTYLCDYCFAGETEVVTRYGIKRIDSLVDQDVEILVPFSAREMPGSRGQFITAPVRHFGRQTVYNITLSRGRATKTVRATAEHRWFVKDRTDIRETTTYGLSTGDKLQNLKAVGIRSGSNGMTAVPFAVAQGIVFGDGTHGRTDGRPGFLTIYDMEKGKAFLPYFSGHNITQKEDGATVIRSLPRFWKDLPPMEESRSFLLSWAAGYFAADGTVDKGGQSFISSGFKEHIEFYRSVLAVCGVGYGTIYRYDRVGFGQELSPLYRMSISRNDLPDWFWIIEQHRERALQPHRYHEDINWTVESVSPDKEEDVYCATVDNVGAFGLTDSLMTGNCVMRSVKQSLIVKDKY